MRLDQLPALDWPLIAELKFNREIVSLGIQMSILTVYPNIAFNWEYEFPCITSHWDEGLEFLIIIELLPRPAYLTWVSFGPVGADTPNAWVCRYLLRMDHNQEADISGWDFQLPYINSCFKLLKNSIRSIKICPL